MDMDMDGGREVWIDGWVGGWIGGWMDGWMDGGTDDGRTYEWANRQINGRMGR